MASLKKTCDSQGRTPEGNPCPSYAVGYCRAPDVECIYQSDTKVEEQAKKSEHVDMPDRIEELLARIAGGNLNLAEQFNDSATCEALTAIAKLNSYYEPTSALYEAARLSNVETVEMDGLHLAALNNRIGGILGLLQADVEDLETFIKELKAKKEIEYERSLRGGLRPGGISDRRIKAFVEQDEQVSKARDMLAQARRRMLIVRNMSERAESTVNMLKVRARGLRRGV